MKNGRLQAKDIDDSAVLGAVRRLNKNIVSRWELAAELGYPPERVLSAKLRALFRRKLLTGCACGCRGDLELTQAGHWAIGESSTPPFRAMAYFWFYWRNQYSPHWLSLVPAQPIVKWKFGWCPVPDAHLSPEFRRHQ